VDGGNRTQYDYDENGRLVRKVFPNNVEVYRSFLPGGYIKEMTSRDKDGIIDSFIYSYDESGKKRDIERYRRNLENVSGVYHFDYDKNGRLTGVERNNELIRKYTYDSYGNRKSVEEAGKVTNYSYDVLNRLVSSEKVSFENNIHEVNAYNYDGRGNMTELLVNGIMAKQYKFDATNMMTWGYDKDKGEASYEYNGIGKRVSVKTPAENIEYILDYTREYNDMLGREVNGKVESFVYDDDVISMNKEGNDYFYLLDDLGSTMRLTGTDGATVASYAYDEFGKALNVLTGKERGKQYSKQGNIIQPFAFTGYLQDDLSDNYYAHARYYDPNSGRFISKDQDIFMHIEDPESLNLYEYCKNNPIDYYDPTGNDAFPWWFQAFGKGMEAHIFLQTYTAVTNPTAEAERNVYGTLISKGRADLVFYNEDGVAEIYEIKPASYDPNNPNNTDKAKAAAKNKRAHAQLNKYVTNWPNNDRNSIDTGCNRARVGTNYNHKFQDVYMPSLIDEDKVIHYYAGTGEDSGLIYYEYIDKPADKELVEAPEKAKESIRNRYGIYLTIIIIALIILAIVVIALLIYFGVFAAIGGAIYAAIMAIAEAFSAILLGLETIGAAILSWFGILSKACGG
jgi:RHS repeat-associated protein